MFRLYRPIQPGEFFVCFGDTAQGGIDKNYVQFMSQTQLDIPLVLAMHGTAAEATPFLIQALRYIRQKTGIPPTVALERQNGGASAMHDLMMANSSDEYTIYIAKTEGGVMGEDQTKKLGWDTNAISRPQMLGQWLTAFNSRQVKIYDRETIEQHSTFIVNKNGKPEAAPNTHDDAVMSCAGVWQMYQTEQPPSTEPQEYTSGNFASAWLS
jgi:hypothetical protein